MRVLLKRGGCDRGDKQMSQPMMSNTPTQTYKTLPHWAQTNHIPLWSRDETFYYKIIIIINLYCRLPKYMARNTEEPIFKYILYTMILKNYKKGEQKSCGKYTWNACNVQLLTAFNKKIKSMRWYINSILQTGVNSWLHILTFFPLLS